MRRFHNVLRFFVRRWESEMRDENKLITEEPSGATVEHLFTESELAAAFAAGANWVRGAIEDGAKEYVEKLKEQK